jgi:polysaccharide pyruvyl transferase WcaK-like protein
MDRSNAVRILTYHSVTNNGAVLQAYSLSTALARVLSDYDVKIIDYLPPALRRNEFLKIFKPLPRCPHFYLARFFLYRRFVRAHLRLDRAVPSTRDLDRMIDDLNARQYGALVVGSDNIWRISKAPMSPRFPNIYWSPERVQAKKLAYAASAYGSDPVLIDRYREILQHCLNDFDFIGVRDTFTLELVNSTGVDPGIPVWEVPDPTFLYDLRETAAAEKLTSRGIDLQRPILGVLIFGRAELSARIREHYKAQGYQIVALSMYNPYADLNLGHILDPFEWADVFRYLTFCITDRFHGAIFCLKNATPFISMEPRRLDSLQKSKIYSVLSDIDVREAYADVDNQNLQIDSFLTQCAQLQETWDQRAGRITEGLGTLRQRSQACLAKVKEVITRE